MLVGIIVLATIYLLFVCEDGCYPLRDTQKPSELPKKAEKTYAGELAQT